MKQFYMLFAALTFGFTAMAQLPDGSTAPDFTATDINGVEWNLYTLLDEGKTVILDFSATWCGPCWSYHEAHVLADLHTTFGPDGSNDLMVFYLESDDTTTQADLEGTGGGTQGDWITGTPYPIIDNASNIFDDYSNTYYPTIYTVCPDYTLTESGQASFDNHVAAAFAPCENSVTGAAPIASYTGDTSACGGGEWNASVEVSNAGSDAVTAMIFEITVDGATQTPVEWTGNLASLGTESVDLGSYTATGNVDINLTSVNGSDWSASLSSYVAGSEEATSYVQVRILTDDWPEETGWSVTDSQGTEIAGVATGGYNGQNNTEFIYDLSLDQNECYSFTLTDGYGDGMFATQWGAQYTDGAFHVISYDGDVVVTEHINYVGADGNFSIVTFGLEVTQAVGVTEAELTSSVNVFPNPFNDQTTLSFTTAQGGDATIIAYNLVGEKVIDMNLGNIPAGQQRVELDFASMEAGIYLVSLIAGGETSTLRVTNAN